MDHHNSGDIQVIALIVGFPLAALIVWIILTIAGWLDTLANKE
jgi:small neutral amino acid transporter SnatA (MarC family)